MDKSLLSPQLPEQLPDPEAFARVWQRVMPDQSHSPLVLCPPADAVSSRSTPENDGNAPLYELLHELSESILDCRKYARRGGTAGRTLSTLAADQSRSLRPLSALWFLRTGTPFSPDHPPEKTLLPLPDFLRHEYQLCRRFQQTCTTLLDGETDPCFLKILLDFQADSCRQAELLCTLLIQFISTP